MSSPRQWTPAQVAEIDQVMSQARNDLTAIARQYGRLADEHGEMEAMASLAQHLLCNWKHSSLALLVVAAARRQREEEGK